MLRYRQKDYVKLLRSLLPPGKYWIALYTSMLSTLFAGLAPELERIQVAIETLFERESYPLLSVDNFVEWCVDFGVMPRDGETDEQVRKVLYARLWANGYPDEQYWVDLGRRLGFDVSVVQLQPPDHSYREFDLIIDAPIHYQWAYAGTSWAGDYTVTKIYEFVMRIEELANEFKLAHTKINFVYSEYIEEDD